MKGLRAHDVDEPKAKELGKRNFPSCEEALKVDADGATRRKSLKSKATSKRNREEGMHVGVNGAVRPDQRKLKVTKLSRN